MHEDFDVLAAANRIAHIDPDQCEAWLATGELLADERTALRNLKGIIGNVRGLLAERDSGAIRPNVFNAVAGVECATGLRLLDALFRFDDLIETQGPKALAYTE